MKPVGLHWPVLCGRLGHGIHENSEKTRGLGQSSSLSYGGGKNNIPYSERVLCLLVTQGWFRGNEPSQGNFAI